MLCRSLRYENKRPCCALAMPESEYCLHHAEIKILLEQCQNFKETIPDPVENDEWEWIWTAVGEKAIRSVEEYMHKFHVELLKEEGWSGEEWWLQPMKNIPRKRGKCRMLKLENGVLCGEKIHKTMRFCKEHECVHDILTNGYHLFNDPWIEENLCKQSIISKNTVAFVEFCLRKQFDILCGYNIGHGDWNHEMWYVKLYGHMFKPPYPLVNRNSVPDEFLGRVEFLFNCENVQYNRSYYPYVTNADDTSDTEHETIDGDDDNTAIDEDTALDGETAVCLEIIEECVMVILFDPTSISNYIII